jgi:AraC family transcriptional regulator
MDLRFDSGAAPGHAGMSVSRRDFVLRRAEHWRGMTAESFEIRALVPFDYSITSNRHLFILAERAARRDGETRIDGTLASRQRDFSRTLCVVPAAHQFQGWQIPRIHSRVTHFYVDADWPLLDPELRPVAGDLKPQLFLDAAALEATGSKLKALIGKRDPGDQLYAEALGVVFQHELLRLVSGTNSRGQAKGGLAPWQKQQIRDYIEANIACGVSLVTLAQFVGLSTFHFAHAFKRSFGIPPHRYFTARRIEHAKALLAAPGQSVTEIALALGFSETSAFTAAFRKATGCAPSAYRRDNR